VEGGTPVRHTIPLGIVIFLVYFKLSYVLFDISLCLPLPQLRSLSEKPKKLENLGAHELP